MKRIFILCLLLTVSSCASLTEQGKNVQYAYRDETPNISSCKPLPLTFGSSKLIQSDVINDMRNDVAEHGGNFLIIDTMSIVSGGSGGYYSGTGRGYICDFQ